MITEKSSIKKCQMLDKDGNRKPFPENRVNQKADQRLRQITNLMVESLSRYITGQNGSGLTQVLSLVDFEKLDKIYLLYQCENRFAAMSYNLFLQSFYETKEEEEYFFSLHLEGALSVRKMEFKDEKKNGNDNPRKQKLLELLNHEIILKKCKDLDILELQVFYLMEEGRWTISVKSLIGSSTWILIPPVMHTIVPARAEIFGMVELMRMIHHAVTI